MGITDYLSRSPKISEEKGEFNDGIFTILLIEDLNKRKNETLKCRIFGKLMKIRRQKKNKTIRNKADKDENKAKLGTKKQRKRNKAEKIGRLGRKMNKLDDVINNCYSELVAKQSEHNSHSFQREMKSNSSLVELSDKLKVLSLESRSKNKKQDPNNLKFCDFPVSAASNSITPLCLENFTFQPNLTEDQMLYHNLVNRISQLPELKVKIASLISQIQEIEQLDKLFFVNGRWQQKEISAEEKS